MQIFLGCATTVKNTETLVGFGLQQRPIWLSAASVALVLQSSCLQAAQAVINRFYLSLVHQHNNAAERLLLFSVVFTSLTLG